MQGKAMHGGSGLPREIAVLTLATDAAMVRRYAQLTADHNPIHLDAAFAAATPFKAPIVHGTLSLNLLVHAIETAFAGCLPTSALSIRFIRPVPVGACIRAGGTLIDAATGSYRVFVDTDTGARAIEGTLSLHP